MKSIQQQGQSSIDKLSALDKKALLATIEGMICYLDNFNQEYRNALYVIASTEQVAAIYNKDFAEYFAWLEIAMQIYQSLHSASWD
ncbi:MAG: hypothetical protein ABIG90_01855 [bacterium]